MQIPFFYIGEFNEVLNEVVLNEETSKHIAQVLRMKPGSKLHLTDGKGNLLTCSLIDIHKKNCTVRIETKTFQKKNEREVSIAVSLIKNVSRFEWFVEKATELGVTQIITLICQRTEKEKFRYDRMRQICISAMLQSRQVWLPELSMPVKFETVVNRPGNEQKFIAHCAESEKKPHLASYDLLGSPIILIGPEGDFTKEEQDLAIKNKFNEVSLGASRLRTETAAICAAVILGL